MAFNPATYQRNKNLSTKEPELKSVKSFIKAVETKNLIEELKEQVNHKKEIFNILKTTQKLSKEELVDLTVKIEHYFSNYLK